MPLEILVPLVVGGIALSIMLVRLLVNTPERLLETEQMVQEVFQADFPLERVDEVLISNDKRLALLKLAEDGRVGFVEVMGSKHVTRIWSASDIKNVETTGKKEFKIELSDFTLPRLTLKFSTAREAEKAQHWIGQSKIS